MSKKSPNQHVLAVRTCIHAYTQCMHTCVYAYMRTCIHAVPLLSGIDSERLAPAALMCTHALALLPANLCSLTVVSCLQTIVSSHSFRMRKVSSPLGNGWQRVLCPGLEGTAAEGGSVSSHCERAADAAKADSAYRGEGPSEVVAGAGAKHASGGAADIEGETAGQDYFVVRGAGVLIALPAQDMQAEVPRMSCCEFVRAYICICIDLTAQCTCIFAQMPNVSMHVQGWPVHPLDHVFRKELHTQAASRTHAAH
jgi:hypothetical protein